MYYKAYNLSWRFVYGFVRLYLDSTKKSDSDIFVFFGVLGRYLMESTLWVVVVAISFVIICFIMAGFNVLVHELLRPFDSQIL